MTTEDVVIVDDHTDTRDGVKQLLERDGLRWRAPTIFCANHWISRCSGASCLA
jgi:hypothetical protein